MLDRIAKFQIAGGTLAWMVFFIGTAICQDEDKRRSELGERQRLVERNMAELESRFVRVAESLQAKEPERAKRLIDTLQHAKERLIAKRMADVTTLLDAGKIDQAEQELRLVVEDLDKLVRMLLNDERDEQTKAQEIETLERWKQQIQEIRQEQNQQTRETSKVANKDETLKGLDEKIKQVEQLVKDQQGLIEHTRQDANSGIRALDRIADKQFDVRQRTEALARELGGETTPADSGEAADPESSGDQSASGKQPDGQPEGKPEPKPDQPAVQPPKNPDSQPADKSENPPGKNGDKSGDSSSAAGQPSGAGKPSDDASPPSAAKKQPGQKPLESSMQHQKGAEENLTKGQPTDAERAQAKALDEMKSALDELNKERRRVASLPREAMNEMAKQQRRTRGKTMDLAKDMSKAKQPSKSEDASADPNKQSPPGQKPVQEAEQAMDNAAGGLEEQDAQRAERQQAKSENKLEEALREIEERLNQLREETRQEKLARLEARFTEMLTRQRVATGSTIDLDDKRTNLARLQRRDQLNLLRLAAEETQISELGQQAYDLLLEDGTSAAFPECVLDLREDLGLVSELLETERTDQLTQLVQREIESALEDLLESLKQAKNDGQGGGGGGGGGKQPLLRKSAELKMLRAAQLRVNRRTKQFEVIRGEQQLDQALESELKNISQRQSEITDMAEQVMEKKD